MNQKKRLEFLVDNVKKITKIQNFGVYMNKLLTIDALFLNEDRHTHNIAVLMNDKQEYKLCPIFDNGAGLLSDIMIDYSLDGDIYEEIGSVNAKTISLSFDEALHASEVLYGMNFEPRFSKDDVMKILYSKDVNIYSEKIREKVERILFEQMRKYNYLF